MSSQGAWAATLVDEWARGGVTDAVVAPGSRSTPLAVALAGDGRIRVHVVLDERSAGFVALGLGIASGRPAVVLTTSGTAAVELHPAVVEAHQALVPLIACTADRPVELHDVGAPQTVDQRHLFGRSVRWYAEPGVADGEAVASWRSVAARSIAEAAGAPPGPVHLNLAFRDPLLPDAADLPPGRGDGAPWHRLAATTTALADRELLSIVGHFAGKRVLVVAGAGAGDPSAVHALARVGGWPVFAEPRSGCRIPRPTTVAHADSILRHRGFASMHRPEIVLCIGAPPASKVVAQWLAEVAEAGAPHVAIAPAGVWWDPERTASVVAHADASVVCKQLTLALGDHPAPRRWLEEWQQADELAGSAIDALLARQSSPTEPRTARDLVAALPEGAALVVSSSMPVRDVEWFAAPRAGLSVYANRGANGIDGVLSTAVGVALARRDGANGVTAALVGDIAFLHDSNALIGLRHRDVDLVVVVVDNDGGGIFSFLPQASGLPADQFELLFGTPHGVRAEDVAAAHGIESVAVEDAAALAPAVASAVEAGGAWLLVVRTDRAANVKVHDDLHAAVARALEGAGHRATP
jgi:2-succinyl-5-enolpyruvyl-6-hydroxy-3-cyclohexene-1-carboxylate synthase